MGSWRTSILPVTALVIRAVRYSFNSSMACLTFSTAVKNSLSLIETILVYKFPTMSREEIEGMFGLSDLKQISKIPLNIPAIFHPHNF